MSTPTAGENRQRRGERGLTLVELMVSTAVLALIALGLAVVQATAPRLNRGTREEMAVQNAMRLVMARISTTPFPEVAATFHRTGFEVEGLTTLPDDEDELPGRVLFGNPPGGETGFYLVRVEVEWVGANGPREVHATHFLANIRGEVGVPPPIQDPYVVSDDEGIIWDFGWEEGVN